MTRKQTRAATTSTGRAEQTATANVCPARQATSLPRTQTTALFKSCAENRSMGHPASRVPHHTRWGRALNAMPARKRPTYSLTAWQWQNLKQNLKQNQKHNLKHNLKQNLKQKGKQKVKQKGKQKVNPIQT